MFEDSFHLNKLIKKFANNHAFVFNHQCISFKEWEQQILRSISGLKKLNLIPGADQIIQMENSPQFITAVFALWALKIRPIIISPQTPCEQPTLTQLPQDKAIDTTLSYNTESCQLVIYTSGSTNNAKGVILSLKNLLYSADGSNQFFKLSPEDRWSIELPMSKIGGLIIPFRTLLAGACSTFNGNATHYSLVPSQITSQKVAELQKAQAVLVGGGPISKEVCNLCENNQIPLIKSYGMSEMASTIAVSTKEKTTILPHRELQISEGHVSVSGKCLFQGYLDGTAPFDARGNFYPGDLAHFENEQLRIDGRSDRVFISGGVNIDPYLVEKVLLECKNVEQAYVLSVKDEKWGKVGIAFIKGASNFDSIKIELSNKLHPYYHPKAYYSFTTESRSQLQLLAQRKWNEL